MKLYTANYSTTNHNFAIQNLEEKRAESKFLPAILILKNILQRGKPTLMSKYLQSEIGDIYKNENFKDPFTLIDKHAPVWNHTIKGDDEKNYYPAQKFFEQIIKEELPDYEFITRLIRPETPINEITQKDDTRFKNQKVDFYLPQAFLVIEIDGQQHKTDDIQRLTDKERDNHLSRHNVKTVRINTKDLENRSFDFYLKITEIKERLNEERFRNILNYYKENYHKNPYDLPENIKKTKLLPTAIIRFQLLILDLLENGRLSLDETEWIIELKNHEDFLDFASTAITDLFIWFEHLLKLQKIEFNKPDFQINQFSNKNNIKVDFSIFKRWTDEDELNENIIFVRTDYFDIYYNRVTQKTERINNFRLSTTKAVKYSLIKDGEYNDLQHLEFFLENIFGYKSFKPGQFSIIENALARRDTIGLLPTGGGKSITYQLACLLQPSISFVVCPIKSLMMDQKTELENSYFQNIETITSEITGEAREQILDNFGNGKYFFIFISPERFQTQKFRNRLSNISANYNFAYAVIDEVHCLSEWGHDFRTSYLNLTKTIRKYCGNARLLGLTATASVNVLNDIQIEFNIKQEDVKTLIDYTRPELDFIVVKDNGNKYSSLKKILNKKSEKENIFELNGDNSKCGLIFTPYVNGKYGCSTLANKLQNDLNIPVKAYSGSKPNDFPESINFEEYKQQIQTDYKNNKITLLTATKAFGMGINKKNIDYTFHYGIPGSMEALYQEAGRAGRNRQKSECYILLSEENEDMDRIFSPNATYEEIDNLLKNIKWNGRDIYRQIFLYQQGLAPIDDELALLLRLHKVYSEPDARKSVSGEKIGTTKALVEKAIYRLSILGIVNDWTIENFFKGGVFTVYYNNYSDDSIRETLLAFIKKYEDNFDFDGKEEHIKYTRIMNRADLSVFQRCALVLLQWSYDKFAYNRRQSLSNVYYNSLAFENTEEGRVNFKKSIEAYFKFTHATYVLQHIAENNDVDFERWFEIFYDKNNNFITEDKLIELEGNLQRFLESYQNNTGLNLINALVILFLNKKLIAGNIERFEKALMIIYNYPDKDYEYIMDQILTVSKQFNEFNRIKMVNFLQKIARSEEEFIYIAKELGDHTFVLEHYNKKLKGILRRFNDGIRKVS